MLLNEIEWKVYFSKLLSASSKKVHDNLKWRARSIRKHFERDYTDCQGSKDLGSPVKRKLVAVDVFEDLRKPPPGDIIPGNLFDFRGMIELENGETLDQEEAIGGLGSFAPAEVRTIKRELRRAEFKKRQAAG